MSCPRRSREDATLRRSMRSAELRPTDGQSRTRRAGWDWMPAPVRSSGRRSTRVPRDSRSRSPTMPGTSMPEPSRSRFAAPAFWERLFYVSGWLAFLALGIPIVGGVWIVIYAFSTSGSHWTYLAVGMSTALAAFLSGFLFGIPKVISSGQLRQQGSGDFSNLAEVSD